MKNSKKTSKISIIPLGDKVIVKEITVEERSKKTASGIIIPDTIGTDKGAKEGEVMAVGSGKYIDGKLVPLDVKSGDRVLFQWGDKITYEGQEYYIVSESSLMAVIK